MLLRGYLIYLIAYNRENDVRFSIMVKVDAVEDKAPKAVFCDACNRAPTTFFIDRKSVLNSDRVETSPRDRTNFLEGMLGNVLLFVRKEEYEILAL